MISNRLEKWIKISISIVMILITVVFVFGILSYFYFTYGLPSIETLRNYKPSTITRFYADDGELISEFFHEKREVVSLERMPDHLIQAFVAGEDARFFQHKGLDYLAILRALFRNIFSGEILQGGSTITQQVVKSLLLSPEKSFARKIREAILAFKIEKNLTKNEILFLYLNQIYLGHGAYGVAAAAETYFGKSIEEVNLAESALLAGLPQAPSKYSPLNQPDQAKKRQQYVLYRMADIGFISVGQLGAALQMPIRFREKQNSFADKAPHFVEVVRKYVEDKYGREALYKRGLRVYTTIDLNFQRMAQESVELGLKEIEKRQRYDPADTPLVPEGSLLCFDLASGYVKAMVGGRDFKKSQFNRAVQARRQTGSAFKPIIYASALDKGYTLTSLVVDAPSTYEWGENRWKPKNYGEKFSGPITFRSALTHSVNVVTVKIAQSIGLDYITDYAKKLGISSPLQNDLSMALGSSSLSLYELTNAYAVFANQGRTFKPIFVKKILDVDGNLIEENLPLFYPRELADGEQALTPETAYLMTYLLQGVVQHGTGWRAKELKRPVAAKTGTTDQFIDAWFIGYTPEFITGVWVGFDNETSLGGNETGSRAASPIWVTFMSKVLKDKPVQDFPIPQGVEFAKIDPRTGQPGAGRETILECFKEGTTPVQEAKTELKTTTDFFKYDFNLSAKTP
jgi:1A family penicillin-binding protein